MATGNAIQGATGPASPPSGAAGGALTGTYPNPGIAAGAVPYVSAEPLTSGESIYLRMFNNTSFGLTTQQVQFTYWTAATTGTATTVTTYVAGTAASGLTYANVGIYSVAGNGDLTLLASTGDVHAAAWPSTFAHYTGTLTGSFSRVAGTRYAMGILAVGTGPPSLYSCGTSQDLVTTAPTLSGHLAGQATLPASVAHGSVAGDFNLLAGIVQP